MKRRTFSWLFIALLASFLPKCGPSTVDRAPSKVDLNGQVFIVTQAGISIKLGLVEVTVLEEPLMIGLIQSKLQEANSEIARLEPIRAASIKEADQLAKSAPAQYKSFMRSGSFDDFEAKVKALQNRLESKRQALSALEAEYQRFRKGAYWMAGLPNPIQETKTDADGNFALKLKPGKYALVALTTRKVADTSEELCWMVWINVVQEKPDRVFLTNDNLIQTQSAECIVPLDKLDY